MTRPPLILICDHRGEGLAGLGERLSAAGFRAEIASHLRGTIAWLSGARADLILIDPLVGGSRVELEVVDRLRRSGPPTPVLVFVDRASPLPAIEAARALQSGPWDLIHRDALPEELALRIERLFDQARQDGELDQLRHRALHDDRTDLLRPSAFQARLDEHVSAAQRHGFELALLLLDLDDFGQVNKAFDHTVGDRVIARVGEVIRGNLRAEDVAGRLGGDEFAILLPYTRRIEAARVANRLRDEIFRLSGGAPGLGGEIQVRASIGFETFDGRDLAGVDELRAHAETALRAAKLAGGNRGLYYRSLAPRGPVRPT